MRICLIAFITVLGFSAGPLCAAEYLYDVPTVLKEVDLHVSERFINRDKVDAISDRLLSNQDNYASEDPILFAVQVSQDLFVHSSDRHMKISYDPALYSEMRVGGTKDSTDQSINPRAAYQNFGVAKVEILEGNIGYLKLTSFHGVDEAKRRVDAAFSFLDSSDAIVMDLRGNGGGDANFVRYVQGYFFEKPTNSMDFIDPGADTPVQTFTLQPSGRAQPSRPLVTIVDGDTASAAEDFAYSVQAFDLGEVVGAPTAGAAHTITRFPIDPGFVLSVSTGKPIHPITGSNWEGFGITPDHKVTPADAATVAHIRALELLLAANPDPEVSSRYHWALLPLKAQLDTPSPSQKRLLSLTGFYTIGHMEFGNGVLVFRDGQGGRFPLSPLSNLDYAIEGEDNYRFRFDTSGFPLVLERVSADGRIERFERLHQ